MAELAVSLALKASLQCFFTSLQGNKPFTSDGLRSQDREQLIKVVPRRRGSHHSGGCDLDSSKVRTYCMEPTRINAVTKWRTVLYCTVCSEKRQVTGARTVPMRTANTVRCVVRHRRVPAPVQSADRPAQSRDSALVVSTITVIAKAHPSLPSDSRSRGHSSHLNDGHSENLESPTVRRCELLRRMTSSRTRSTRRGCAVTAGSHLLCGQSRCELAEPASCLPVVSLIGWYLVLAPICPRRNSVRVRNMLSTANPALSKNPSIS
jgi:hypothetical protein